MTENKNSFEQQLFKAADKLRKNIDAAEYKYVVLGLVFIKYISETFNELYEKLETDQESHPEDRDEYLAENVFFVPATARWSHIHNSAKLPSIGETIDEAMEAIESENKELKNVLPKVYGKANLDKASLGQLIDLISNTELQAENEKSKDLFGRVYEYFLGEFANAEGKKGGQFYTPKAIVKLMVEMIEPYKGRVYDPACGSGGMFVMSEKFVTEHQGNISDITVYGQESNQTTWKLSKMNLAIRNINSQFVSWNTEGSFLKDAHPDLKADFILANPPFNQKDWGLDILQDDARWKYGVPANGNANYGWIMHMLYHLAPKGVMATVFSISSLSSKDNGEGNVRENLIHENLVECIVSLPNQLFFNTGIPACIWFLRKEKSNDSKEVLFINASEMGFMKDTTHREFEELEISKITNTYHNWRKGENYQNIKGFCKSASLDEIKKQKNILTVERYTGVSDSIKDKIVFKDKIALLNNYLIKSSQKSRKLDEEILSTLNKNFPHHNWTDIDFNSNEILEEIAQTIFNEWHGNPLEYKLPKSWRIARLGDEFDITIGRTPPRKEKEWFSKTPTGKKWISIKDIGKSGTYISETLEYLTEDAIEKFNIPIIPKNTTILSFKMTVGKLCITNEDMLSNEAIAHIKLKTNSYLTSEFIYLLLKGFNFKSLGSTSSIATAINSTIIKDINFIVPSKEFIDKFQEQVLPIFKKIHHNILQTQSLSKNKESFLSVRAPQDPNDKQTADA